MAEDEQRVSLELQVPLEQQLSADFSSVLTPSGQTAEVIGAEVPHADVTSEYLGAQTHGYLISFNKACHLTHKLATSPHTVGHDNACIMVIVACKAGAYWPKWAKALALALCQSCKGAPPSL